jgi:hypothetical protein
MELSIFALFGSLFWGAVAISIFIIMCFVADISENGFLATFFLLVIGALFFFYGKEAWKAFVSIMIFKNFVIYFGLGLVHAFIRIYFYGRSEMKLLNKDRIAGKSYEHNIDKDSIKGHVFRWWFLWPIALIDWVVKDLIKDVYDWFYKLFSDMFDFFLNLGIKSVKEVPKVKKEEDINPNPNQNAKLRSRN